MYLFTYFKNNGEDGLHLALSEDGLHYRSVNGDEALLVPGVGESKLMRDPAICRGPDGTFHLVWTTSWEGQTIGYTSSNDLIHWSPQKAIAVMGHEPTCLNAWAPEIVFDEKLGHFVIFWASTIPGRFADSDASGDGKYNHRMYVTTTTDFEHFEPTRLLFDPGFSVIDATFYRDGDALRFIVKDETKTPPRKCLQIAKAESYTGPFDAPSPAFTESWVEGPTALKLGGDAVCFFDAYTRKRYGATRSSDLATWTDISEQITIPAGARHGTVIEVDDAIGRELERRTAKPLIAQRADPHVYRHTDGYYYFTASVPTYDCVEVRRARTIAGLASAPPSVVWFKHAHGEMGGFIWAPEIHFIDGRWVIYFAAGRSENKFAIRMYAIENRNADPLVGAWRELGQIRMGWESFTLDATTFVHRGTRYLAWAQSVDKVPGTSVFLAKMRDATTLDGPQACLTSPTLPWERIGHHVNEGPAFLVRHGRVFMTYSASATDANYCMGLLSADENADLMDPKSWTKSPQPVLASDATIGQFGPGHNSFTVAEDGNTDLLIYHARTYETIEGEPLHNPDRATFVRVVRWRADGTPSFGG